MNEILSRLIPGFIQVIERRMHYYIVGNLSNIPSHMASQMLSAPVCRETLGLADYHFRNVKIGFVDGKIKSKIYHGFVRNLKTIRKVLLNFV